MRTLQWKKTIFRMVGWRVHWEQMVYLTVNIACVKISSVWAKTRETENKTVIRWNSHTFTLTLSKVFSCKSIKMRQCNVFKMFTLLCNRFLLTTEPFPQVLLKPKMLQIAYFLNLYFTWEQNMSVNITVLKAFERSS